MKWSNDSSTEDGWRAVQWQCSAAGPMWRREGEQPQTGERKKQRKRNLFVPVFFLSVVRWSHSPLRSSPTDRHETTWRRCETIAKHALANGIALRHCAGIDAARERSLADPLSAALLTASVASVPRFFLSDQTKANMARAALAALARAASAPAASDPTQQTIRSQR